MLESAGGIWGRAFSKEAYFPSRLRRRIQYSRFLTVRVVFLTDIAMSKRGLLWATFAMSVRRDRKGDSGDAEIVSLWASSQTDSVLRSVPTA